MNDQQIKQLHRNYATSDKAFDLVYTHCRIVAEISRQLIAKKHLAVDNNIVRVGALLHDIGAYRFINTDGTTSKHYVRHGIVGSHILASEKLPEAICRIAERHTGVGLSQEDILRQKLPLPSKDYLPQTTEEKLVLYSDKFHSKEPRFNSFEYYRRYVARWGKEKSTKFEELAGTFGIPELEELATKYGHPIV